jgi:hypothetical protein
MRNDKPIDKTTDQFQKFAGTAACETCHKNIFENHLKSAHYLTSQPASQKYIKGNFERGKNFFAYNPDQVVAMEKRGDSFYEVAYTHGLEKLARSMDIVTGSGTMGQSFLNWRNNFLVQLPITYFTAANEWSNSPGFPNSIVYNRPITSRCMECHSTYVNTISPAEKEPEEFDRTKIIYGVTCEKCHGTGAMHVAYQTQNPQEKFGKFIINPAKFSRQQKLDMCALCHGGHLQKTKASFSFTPGDTLDNYFNIDTTAPDPNNIDVHGNQYGLMRSSKCFINSNSLTCNTCHNTHENERGNTKLFSQRCMTCHKQENGTFCKLKTLHTTSLRTNCIDCHMPLKPSKAIAVFLPGDNTPTAALIRSHLISVYPIESKKIQSYMKTH